MLTDMILQTIDAKIQEKHLLNHTFYRAWSMGLLSMECLQEYAKNYYFHVLAFPMYLSAVHSHAPHAAMRRTLLQNLIEEEAGSPNHPELWKQFALSLGVTENALATHKPSAEIQNVIATFQTICRTRSPAEGIAALYAYESQIPAVCVSKIEGLQKYYGMTHPQDWHYFTIHIAADTEHAAQERALLAQTVTAGNHKEVYVAVDQALTTLWNFLSGLCEKYQIAA